MDYTIQRLWINSNSKDRAIWEQLLGEANLKTEQNLDKTFSLYDGDTPIGTGSVFQNIIKCVAIKDEYRGGPAFNQLISHLMNEIYDNGYSSIYVYTKPASKSAFSYLGFTEIAEVDHQLVFLEKSMHPINDFVHELKTHYIEGQTIGGIVMNANPFTKGHQYLIDYASSRVDVLHLFILEEDASVFPTEIRKRLVAEGTAQFKNVHIHSTGDYMVSTKTFPSYFLPEDADVTRTQAKLDATVFKRYIAPALGITIRFVGEEPLSFATNIYNEAMRKVFAGSIELVIIKRLESGTEVISASRVRKLFGEGDFDAIKQIVPETTYNFLISDEAKPIQDHLKK